VSGRSFPVFLVDAFTRERFRGNPALVVLEAAGLSTDEMRTLANELHHGDTAFVLPADDTSHDLKVRFFTPTREVPFVAHATVAAHFALGLGRDTGPARVRQLTGAGIVEVALRRGDGPCLVAMTLAPPTLGKRLGGQDMAQVLDALGVSSAELDPQCPPQIVVKGGTRLLIGLKSAQQLEHLRPDLARLRRLSANLGADGYFVFARAGTADGCLTESRMFCPAIGIDEDPVSGNAHGMLAVYLHAHGLLRPVDGRVAFAGLQGRALGRLGRVEVELALAGGRIASVTICGAAALVYRTTVEL
jgi:PhzF family phenazine biosynthesis protein